MVRLAKLTDYAVALMTHLASQVGVQTARDLAEATRVPNPTVSKLLKLLTRGELLVSTRGTKGGYRLSRSPAAITVGQIVRAVEGPLALTECLEEGEPPCARQATCAIRGSWVDVNEVVRGALEQISLVSLVEKRGDGKVANDQR